MIKKISLKKNQNDVYWAIDKEYKNNFMNTFPLTPRSLKLYFRMCQWKVLKDEESKDIRN